MVRAVVVKGHLLDSRRVELDEPVDAEAGEVEVIVRVADPASSLDDGESVSAFLRGLPPGTRSKEDIDRQIREERESWD